MSQKLKCKCTRNLPGVATRTNDGDRGAGNTNEDVQVLNDDAQETEKLGGIGAASTLDGVAALDGASVAITRGNAISKGEGSKGSSDESREFELHVY